MQIPHRPRRAFVLVAALVTALLAAPPAFAGADLGGGVTTLTLDRDAARAFSAARISVAPTRPAAGRGRTVAFPISGGNISPSTGVGLIRQRGGLRFRSRRAEVTYKNFRIRLNEPLAGTARAGAGTAQSDEATPLFTLDTSAARVTRAGFLTRIGGIRAVISRGGARALNRTLRTSLFEAGIELGTISIDTIPSELLISGGTTSLELDPNVGPALTALGISAAPLSPAAVVGDELVVPVTRGRIGFEDLRGRIFHAGGLRLSRRRDVDLTAFTVEDARTPTVTALVDGRRTELFALDFSRATVRVTRSRRITFGTVTVTLSSRGARTLNRKLGVRRFRGRQTIGTATIRLQAR